MTSSDELAGSYDIDVVGLVDLEFKTEPEPDFFDFDSTGEFGLFGEAGVALHTASTPTSVNISQGRSSNSGHYSGNVSLSPTTTSYNSSPSISQNSDSHNNNNSPSLSSPTNKKGFRTARNKSHWNEMEKYLFQKGLELFGPNWNKISKFISTKSCNQVRSYHLKWAETANVIQECDDLTNSYSFIPVTSSDSLFVAQFEDPLGLIETATTTVSTTPMNSKSQKSFQPVSKNLNKMKSPTEKEGGSKMLLDRCFESETDTDSLSSSAEVLVSSLDDDWNIGSEVSIGQELSSVSSYTQDLLQLSKRKVYKVHNEKNSITNKNKISFGKKVRQKKSKKLNKKSKKSTRDSTLNKRGSKQTNLCMPITTPNESDVLSECQLFEGQLVHMSKEENDDDKDVDIDISDEELMIADKSLGSQETKNTSTGAPVNSENNHITAGTKDSLFCDNRQQVFNFPIPKEETELDLNHVSEEERLVHFEYFDGKGVKTPERYIKIRNFLINFWKQIKPKYVRKTAARNGLKSCGDVNSFGKIHEYLEKRGIINFGCSEANYTGPLLIGSKPKEKSNHYVKKSKRVDRSDMARSKQRKKYDVALSEGGGLTISHDEFGAVVDTCHISEPPRQRQNNEKRLGLFKLVQCLKHEPGTLPPFSVVIHSYALVTFDIHSHTSHGEVMGLLGGYHDPISRAVHVTIAVPTRSVSSGIECDMCPLSQNAACTKIHESGVQVVGWYHSHPTFPPHPSFQDIDTQSQMQSWFAKQKSPFLGIIISPFCPTNPNESSHIRCLVLDKPPSSAKTSKVNNITSTWVPYQLDWKVTEEISGECEDVGRSIHTVIDMGREDSLAVAWRQEWGPLLTYWEKALKSINTHLPPHPGMSKFIDVVRNYFLLAIKGIKDS